jgi:receptor expression-enhancing protein 5/6
MNVLKQVSDASGVPIKNLLQYTLIAGVFFVMFGVG